MDTPTSAGAVPIKRGVPLFPRKRTLLFWVDIISAVFLTLLIWIDRSLPLNQRSGMGGAFVTAMSGMFYAIFPVALIITIIMLIKGLIDLLSRKKATEALALWFPLAIQALAVVAFIFIPLTSGFEVNRPAYIRAVSEIEAKTPPDKQKVIKLAGESKRLSYTGEAIVAKAGNGSARVFFLLDQVEKSYQRWLVYEPTDLFIKPKDITSVKKVKIQIKKIEPHWFDVLIN